VRNLISSALKSHGADYVEIRIEDHERSRISFRGKQVDELSTAHSIGGCVRALASGGWGFVSFNDIVNLRDHVKLAVDQAETRGKHRSRPGARGTGGRHRYSGACQGPEGRSACRRRKPCWRSTTTSCWNYSPKVQTTGVAYVDRYSKRYFANSEGTFIEQEHCDVGATFTAFAKDGDNVQQMFTTAGGITGFQAVEGLHEDVRDVARRAVECLDAKARKGRSVRCDS
jgi:TldD protein